MRAPTLFLHEPCYPSTSKRLSLQSWRFWRLILRQTNIASSAHQLNPLQASRHQLPQLSLTAPITFLKMCPQNLALGLFRCSASASSRIQQRACQRRMVHQCPRRLMMVHHPQASSVILLTIPYTTLHQRIQQRLCLWKIVQRGRLQRKVGVPAKLRSGSAG